MGFWWVQKGLAKQARIVRFQLSGKFKSQGLHQAKISEAYNSYNNIVSDKVSRWARSKVIEEFWFRSRGT